jgi:putative inorganic carbon (hco3(-)) transporter
MAKTVVKKGSLASQKIAAEPLKLLYVLFLVAYGYITVFTPNMNTYDSNGPKFVALAFLNLLTFIFLFSRKELRTKPGWYYGFFGNAMGFTYLMLMAVSLLSFVKAINLTESILHFAKIFSVFSSAYLISVLVRSEKRGLLYLSAAMTLLLLYDCFTVFSDIRQLIEGELTNIGKIKSVYSNKNILAAAVFVKIPFALWLMMFQKKGWRILGMVATPLAMLAVFFMSARAFYLGLFILSVALTVFLIVRYYHTHERSHIKTMAILVTFLLTSLMIFSVVEHYAYPKPTGGTSSASVGARLATISNPDSRGLRTKGWVRSWHVFKDNPLLGVGLGNWKVATLKEENLTSLDYVYQYKAHNDFIEITTETGIFGGILFIAIFVFLFLKFLQLLLKKSSPQGLTFLFLPTVGLFCYIFDAFFNFPQDRPEIQSLFALYTGIAIALTSFSLAGRDEKDPHREKAELLAIPVPFLRRVFTTGTESPLTARVITIVVFLAFQAVSAWVLVQYFNSLKLQRIVKQEILKGKLTSPASMFLEGFPAIPNLNGEAEPIAVQKARYLLNEKRYKEAISILQYDHSSPFDSRPEYFMAMAYMELKKPDSTLFYSKKVYELKPNNFKNITILTNTLHQEGRSEEAEIILGKYLAKHPDSNEALRYASGFYDRAGNIQKATALIDSAAIRFPNDTTIVKLKTNLNRRLNYSLHKETFDIALAAFKAQKYVESARLLSTILAVTPSYPEAREYRAFSCFYLKEYAKSNIDLDFLLAYGVNGSNLLNLRGVNYYNLGNVEEACKNFKAAMEKGDKDGITNYNRFCNKTVPQIKALKTN